MLIVGAGAVLLLAGCAGAAEPAVAEPVIQAATPTVTPSPTPTPTPADAVPTIGVPYTHNGDWTVTLHELVLDSAPDGPQPPNTSDRWSSIDVENCNGSTPEAYLTSDPWRLVSSDNRQFQASSTGYSSFPEPNLTFGDAAIAPGECIRGWFTFVTARDASITEVKYAPASGEGIRWVQPDTRR
ncbi:hypothetical protein EDD25_1232 [Cryobacterium psychrophilum]|nr:hypothetical protein EDD25_1232 [Cryobacterium psychrophilum]